ncbi:chemotaxis response regulator protein-glutamate methylesterase [Nocardioides sp. AE5]|uniref:protein-glutamate methylesterase/protein-glutamine glutaminase n=1 Tax=Nocardioides sp. AE5 TaxID=2962573 RepID=UPI002881F74B|nr:chemotaxis response regulator protein-glutamate methylesterase [Nocardioides sp. AE5]MDT0200812.1 chemotaxis response regulator protein-glutamate methylesterase [Nocardioides sp. AE5]
MIRVLVVDDSALVRRLVTTALADDPEIEVVGTAVNGLEAIERTDELAPDVITLDIEMPALDGLDALKVIRERHPRQAVIMFSTLTERGARQTLEALSLGASDYLTKPSATAGGVAQGVAMVREQLVPRVKALAGVRRVAATPRTAPARPPVVPASVLAQGPEVVVLGCSTGGPDALALIFAALPADFPVPIVIVQHMPPVFTRMLAERLDRLSGLEVREAADGDVLRPGLALLAPGDFHLRLVREGPRVVARLDQSEPVNFCRPAVDVLFDSALATFGGNTLAVVLTGMGTDGLAGVEGLARRGAVVVVQDEASSVVWGMPGAVAEAGLAHEVVPLDRVAARLSALVR